MLVKAVKITQKSDLTNEDFLSPTGSSRSKSGSVTEFHIGKHHNLKVET